MPLTFGTPHLFAAVLGGAFFWLRLLYLAKNLSQCNAKTIDTGLGGSVRSRVKSIHPATLVGILVQSIKVNSDALVNENHVDGLVSCFLEWRKNVFFAITVNSVLLHKGIRWGHKRRKCEEYWAASKFTPYYAGIG